MSGASEIPEAAVEATAGVLYRDYASEYNADHLTWRDFAGVARQALEAALPHLAPQGPDLTADLEWLLAAGLVVQVTPCGGAGQCCGDTAGRFSVCAAKPDPVAALPLPGGVESHGHSSPGEALAFARDWCEQEGITP